MLLRSLSRARRAFRAAPLAKAVAAATVTATATCYHICANNEQRAEEPTFTADQVALHDNMADRVWVTFGGAVYDVTEFITHHPGGNHILLAAGGPLEPLWAQWQGHLTDKVLERLQRHRIGRLAAADQMRGIYNVSDPYDDEPTRDPRLNVLGERPFDCESAHEALASSFYTPQHLFYVRNHLPVPPADDDGSSYSLHVDLGGGRGSRTLSLADLRERLPQARLEATLQCTGNRCNELEPTAAGGIGQIGHAVWHGVWLRDVLRDVLGDAAHEGHDGGVPISGHVHAVGRDGYEVSIPLEKAVDPRGDTLLAHTCNGEPLSRDHGAPVRLLVPGFVGARSVKWVSSLSVHGHESDSVWQRRYYRVFPPWVKALEQIDYGDDSVPSAYAFPVQSAIVTPAEGGMLTREADGTVRVRGYAVSGNGQRVVSVRVSADEGKHWCEASIERGPRQSGHSGHSGGDGSVNAARSPGSTSATTGVATSEAPEGERFGRHWGWVLWEARVPVPADSGELRLCCKATDSAYNTQPERADHIYNLRGYMSNAWPRVKARVE